MQFNSIFSIAALMAPLALAAPITTSNPATIIKRGAGTANIYNNCKFDVSVNPCFNGEDDGTTTIAAGDKWSHELMSFGGAGQGVSLKVSSSEEGAQGVAQLEYTVNEMMAVTFFDLSLIDGNPFGAYDQNIVNEEINVFCAAGVADCKEAYMTPTDNWANHGTAAGTDLDYYLCGGAPSSDESS